MNKKKRNSYKNSGVDVKKSAKLVTKIEKISSNYMRKEIMKNSGGFSSLLDIKKLNYSDPILLTSTDGIGTKLKLAIEYSKYTNLGFDLVGMCVNDILVNGGEPLIFLDYLASSNIDRKNFIKIIRSIHLACKESGCSLVGGETAEMPGLYQKNDFDIAGFTVGVVERKNLINKQNLKNDSLAFGIESNGFHSNGYSLIRKVLKENKINLNLKTPYTSKEKKIGDDLLLPTRIYVKELLPLIKKKMILSMAHITGGGISDNLERVIPDGMQLIIDIKNYKSPERFSWLSKIGNISPNEMLKTFNCGIGLIFMVSKRNKNKVLDFFLKKKIQLIEVGYIKKKESAKKVLIKKFPPWV